MMSLKAIVPKYPSEPSKVDRLAGDFLVLYRYLGDITFSKLAKEYLIKVQPTRNQQDVGGAGLVSFLESYFPFKHFPEVLELAILENALQNAINAEALKLLMFRQLDALNLDQTSTAKLVIQPSAQLLIFNHNTTSIWSALKCDERPPRPHNYDIPQHVLVWRQRGGARFRILGEEEALSFNLVQKGREFREILIACADNYGQSNAIERLKNYVWGWAEAELLGALPDARLK